MAAPIRIFKQENSRNLVFGLLVLALMTYLAYGLAGGLQNRLSQNPLLIAVLFGIFVGNVFKIPEFMRTAIDFTIAYLIKTAVVLIGLNISVQVLVSIGYKPVLLAVGEAVSVFIVVYFFLSRVMRLDRQLCILISAGSSICGAAAILATASVVKAENRLITLSVTMITLMGTFQLFLYPYLYHHGYLESLNDQLFGFFAGAGIYEFAQVYGAGYAVSDTAVNFATLIKLIKVMMIVPMVLLTGHFYNYKQQEENTVNQVKFPWFILFFILMVILNSLFTINGTVKFFLGQTGASFFLMAMVALGLKTDIKNILLEHNFKKLIISAAFIIGFTTFVAYFYTLGTNINIQAKNRGDQISQTIHNEIKKDYYGGKEIFINIGCVKCHVESLHTKSSDPLLLYSDLLIHDMGPALDDKIIQGQAIGTDWRTTPLVGIGNRSRYLHDGRAFTYRDAIIAHGGEAMIVRDRFIDLSQREKAEIFAFFDTLK
ncbi:putative sulfate exporter family transporter [Nostoc sp.]|uniref:putative sulfate exporter family transporter n=1 Tax=Nostoc sp. TaxID=1180 RepID=UPI002FFCFB36